MKLSHLDHFIAAATRGSLRAAARELNVAQPALSRSLREIEHDMGAALFERHQLGVTLTPMGEAFLRRALAAFHQRFPDARVKVTTGFFPAAEPHLLNGQLDFYVGPLRDRSALTKFAVEKLFVHRWVVVGRKGHPLADRRSLDDLGQAGWAKVSLTDSSHEADISRPFEERGLPRPRIVLKCSSATTTLMAVATSDLLTIVPLQLLNTPVARAQFTVFDLDSPLDGAPIHAVRRADLMLTPLAECFNDMVRRAALRIAAPR